MATCRIIGAGRAGSSLSGALRASGWHVLAPLGRHDDLTSAARGTDLLVIAVPDGAVPAVAAVVTPVPTTVVAHLAGALGLDVLAPHARVASLHPLVALPDEVRGAERLRTGTWFAVAGDDLIRRVVDDLGGHAIEVADEQRAAHHAAACIASNHLVALLAQVERVAAAAGLPLAAYLDLVRATVDNVADLGPVDALTGPVARGDWGTVDRHLATLPEVERPAYVAMAESAARLAGRALPAGTLDAAAVLPC